MMFNPALEDQLLEDSNENIRALLPYFQRLSQEVDPLHWANLTKIAGNIALQAFAVTAFASAVVAENSPLVASSTISVNFLLNGFFSQAGFNDLVDFCETPSVTAFVYALPRLAISALSSIIYVEIAAQSPWLFEGLSEGWSWTYLVPYMVFSWLSAKRIIDLAQRLFQPLNIADVFFATEESIRERAAHEALKKQGDELFKYYISLPPNSDEAKALFHQIRSFFQNEMSAEGLNYFLAALKKVREDGFSPKDTEMEASCFKTYFKPVATASLWVLCSTPILGYFAETSQSFEEQGETGTFYQLCTLSVMAVMSAIVAMVSSNIPGEIHSLFLEGGYKDSFLWRHEYLRWASVAAITGWTVWACFSAGLAVALAKGYITEDNYFLDADWTGAVIFNVYAFPVVLVSFIMSINVIAALRQGNEPQIDTRHELQDFSNEPSFNAEEHLMSGDRPLNMAEEALYIQYMTAFQNKFAQLDASLQAFILRQLGAYDDVSLNQESTYVEDATYIPSKKQFGINATVFIVNAVLAALCFTEKDDLLSFSSARLLMLGGMLLANVVALYAGHVSKDAQGAEFQEMKEYEEEVPVSMWGKLFDLCRPALPLLAGAMSLLLTEVAVLYFKGVLEDMPREFVTVPVSAFTAAHAMHTLS